MAYKDGPREQGRYRTHHRAPPDRLYSLIEMAQMLGMDRQTLWERLKAHDGTVPPAFQPGGPGTRWKFSERSYLAWVDKQSEG